MIVKGSNGFLFSLFGRVVCIGLRFINLYGKEDRIVDNPPYRMLYVIGVGSAKGFDKGRFGYERIEYIDPLHSFGVGLFRIHWFRMPVRANQLRAGQLKSKLFHRSDYD